MTISDSRVSWREYWQARPHGVRLAVMAILAGLIAMYGVMGLLAVVGVWRNNLFRLDTNWPWAFPLAGISLIEYRFKRRGLFHAILFIPLLGFVMMAAIAYGYAGHLNLFWMSPTGLVGIALLNIFAFKQLEGKAHSTK